MAKTANRSMPLHKKLTPKNRRKFLDVLAEYANVSEACRAVGISRVRAYHVRDNDPEFAEQWQEAIDMAVDRLKREAWRRGMDGVEEPVHYQGERVDTITRYSDKMLTLCLRAHCPEFREALQVSGPNGGPVAVATMDTSQLSTETLREVLAARDRQQQESADA